MESCATPLHGPPGSRRTLETALAAYDGVELHDPPATAARALARGRVVRARLVLARPAREPLADGELNPDPLEGIAAAMADLDCAAGEHAAVALDLQPLSASGGSPVAPAAAAHHPPADIGREQRPRRSPRVAVADHRAPPRHQGA